MTSMNNVDQANVIIPGTEKLYAAASPFADVALRVAVGALLIPHGAQKLFGWFGGHGLEGTAGWFESIGFAPGILFAFGIGMLEFVGGILLTLGLLTRPLAAAVLGFMVVAIFQHLPAGYAWNTGGFEMPLMWALLAFVVLVRGAGAYSLDRAFGREF